jgi:hypothetical protein
MERFGRICYLRTQAARRLADIRQGSSACLIGAKRHQPEWASLRICRITPSREVSTCSPAGHRIWPDRRYHRLGHGHSAAADSRVGSCWLLAKKPISTAASFLIHKLPTIPTVATPATATPTAAAPADAAPTAAATARRRRRRRRNPDSTTAAAAAARTGVVPTATPSAATPATRTDVCRTIVCRSVVCRSVVCGTIAEALCFSVGGNGGSSECEGCCEHGRYPA